jgi:predicted phosphohydrolase
MRFVVISDTHSHHHELTLPAGDTIIHAGDISEMGTISEVKDFLEWFAALDFKHKIFIGGNHDIYLDEFAPDFSAMLPPEVTYLRNNGCTIEGIKCWGSPVSPDLIGWAFGKYRSEMAAHWRYMPEEIDILITHTPPYGILDQSSSRVSLGCPHLLTKVQQIQPKYHIFGHIHAGYGEMMIEDTVFINASIMDTYRGPVNFPLVFDYSK